MSYFKISHTELDIAMRAVKVLEHQVSALTSVYLETGDDEEDEQFCVDVKDNFAQINRILSDAEKV